MFFIETALAEIRGDRWWGDRQAGLSTVSLNLGVSDYSKPYLPISREIVAQLEVRKALIFLENPGFRIPYFEPGSRRFEYFRARQNQRALVIFTAWAIQRQLCCSKQELKDATQNTLTA